MNILLVEPNYKNKYPPMGLMKLSTYHKNCGDKVVFFKGIMEEEKFKKYNFDRVYITTLFTFYYNITVKTIKKYQKLITPSKIYIGGIMASLMKEELEKDIGDKSKILTGLLTNDSILGFEKNLNIDILPLDYGILDEIEYKYPSGDNYLSYTSRGCTNKCKFCAVPILEPDFYLTNNLKNQIKLVNQRYGEKQNLLLLDNNILSFKTDELIKIVEDIYSLGFDKKTKFISEIPLKKYLRKLRNISVENKEFNSTIREIIEYLNEKIIVKKSKIYESKYLEIIQKINEAEDKYRIIIENEEDLFEILERYHKAKGRKKLVDFNQGIDARQLTEEKMRILSKIPISPFRLAFDSIKYKEIYIKAMRLAHKYGVTKFSNYILYNFEDTPEELWERLKINIDLVKELKDIKVFSFPMKYASIELKDRKYIGKNWNKQYLRNIYAILNVTKGIVADGEEFFYKAFGKNKKEFFEILSMPKEFVTYRQYFAKLGLTEKWRNEFIGLDSEELKELLDVLSEVKVPENEKVIKILDYYKIKK